MTKSKLNAARKAPDLRAYGDPKDAPEWLTPQYLNECRENTELQKKWEPKVGDWYFCTDLYHILKIESVSKYYSEGDPCTRLASDSSIGSIARGGCDVWIPNPETRVNIEKKILKGK
ncbi:MAG TPA: hypothetical protein HA282_00295 [Nanoarchaeota archaeon]|nr:hypothetical protein [Candidatus Pacearchaeota archaeon]HIH18147.1 hypothetical protein [Nanoarchaeota archaeon]HIH34124.1 hypothetical protein [Nanoarchaeota archaeon]HIH51302.1 hypothetical protein [Nanoarchaeota archaeon]HIH65641.1 hypothetical protein [Nanoarchaeota archaeon]